jgi:hypothetical protein
MRDASLEVANNRRSIERSQLLQKVSITLYASRITQGRSYSNFCCLKPIFCLFTTQTILTPASVVGRVGPLASHQQRRSGSSRFSPAYKQRTSVLPPRKPVQEPHARASQHQPQQRPYRTPGYCQHRLRSILDPVKIRTHHKPRQPRTSPVPVTARHSCPSFHVQSMQCIADAPRHISLPLLKMDEHFSPRSAHSDDALAQSLHDPMFEPQPSFNFADSHSEEPRALQPSMGSPNAPNQNQQNFFNPVNGTR